MQSTTYNNSEILINQNQEQRMTWVESFFAFFNGMVAGWSQVFVMQPFEIIKVRLQTQSSTAKIYDGIVDCLFKIVKNEGPLALYKGTLTPLIGVGMLGSMRFGAYEFFKKTMGQAEGKSPADLKRIEKSTCAFFAGAVNTFLLTPIQHTRIRVQIQRSAAQRIYTGSVDAFIKITKQQGIRGLYRGFTPSFVRQSTGLALYFSTIEYLTDHFTPPGVKSKKDLPMWVPLIAGGIGGTSYWVFNYPFDYVKTLMQTDKFGEFKYKSTVDCFRKQFSQGGIRTFFKGYIICMMRSFPVNAAALVTYRIMQRVSNVAAH